MAFDSRTRVASQFRDGTGLTMFTSDVSARGVDYPDVTLVLQVSMHLTAMPMHRCMFTGLAALLAC